MKTGIELIAAERKRQIESERWTPEHDDSHQLFQLSRAAGCYAFAAGLSGSGRGRPSLRWPWAIEWWKPSADPIRMLEKAGALIAAEIDRLQRLKQNA